jgi:hypothetical protein
MTQGNGATATSGIKARLQKKRKYDDGCLQLELTCVGNSSTSDVQCHVMLQDIRKQLQRHVCERHPDCKNRSIGFLRRKCGELKRSETDLTLVTKRENLNLCEEYHRVGRLNAHCGEANETPKISHIVLADNHLKVITKFPSSISGVSRRIEPTNSNMEFEATKISQ